MVLAVIAILASLIIINLNTKKKTSSINLLQSSAEQIITSSKLYLDDNSTATSVAVNYLVPDYMTALPKNQEIVGGVISLNNDSVNFDLIGNGGSADGCIVHVIAGELPTAEEIRSTCP